MKRRSIAWFMAVLMTVVLGLGMSIATAAADDDENKTTVGEENALTDDTSEAPEEWQLWVGNLQITEENKDQYITVTETDESGNTVEKGTVSYTSSRNVLTLYSLTGVVGTHEGCAIYYTGEDPLKIHLYGTNTIETDAAGIVSLKGDIRLIGYGTLTLTAGESAIRSAGNVNLGGGTLILTAKGGTAGDVDVAVVQAGGNVSCSSDVTIDGTKVGYGIKAAKDVSVSGSKVDVSGMVYGVYSGENISVSGNGSTVTIEAVGENAVEAVTAGGKIQLESNQFISVPEFGKLDGEAKHIVESDNAAAKKAVIKGKKTYPVYVGGVQVTEDNCDSIPVAAGKASFDPDKYALHLDNAQVTAAEGFEDAITSDGPLTIVLTGVNSVKGNTYGIYAWEMVFEGDGELQISGDKAAIYAYGDLTIESGVKLTATARKIYDEEDYAGAIYNMVGSIFCKGDIVAVGGGSGIITVSGDIVISSGSVVASGKRFGIDASMAVRIKGENTTVTAEISGDYTSPVNTAYVMIAGDEIEISDNLMIQTPEETKFVSVEYGEQTIVDKDENLPLKVVIVPKRTVSFDAGNGSGTMDDITTGAGSEFILPENEFTAPEGYEFGGWLVGDAAEPVEPGTGITVTENVTVKAYWTESVVEVTPTPSPTATVAPTETPVATATPVPTATIAPTPADGGEGQAPNTADNSSMTLWAVLVLVSAAFTAVLLIRKRKSAN